MSFTRPKLDIDGAAGVASCYLVDPIDIADDEPLYDPYANLDRTLWHSSFQYFEVIYDQTATVTLPARPDPVNGPEPMVMLWVPQEYPPTFNYDTEQMNMRYADLSPFPGITLPTSGLSFVFLTTGGDWQPNLLEVDFIFNGFAPTRRPRYVAPRISGSSLLLRDYWARNAPAWAARTITIRAIVVGPRVEVPSDALFDCDPVNGRVQIGKGKLDTLGRGFLREVVSGGLALTADRTMDSTSTGYRTWKADGTSVDTYTYGGSYAGPTLRRVAP